MKFLSTFIHVYLGILDENKTVLESLKREINLITEVINSIQTGEI